MDNEFLLDLNDMIQTLFLIGLAWWTAWLHRGLNSTIKSHNDNWGTFSQLMKGLSAQRGSKNDVSHETARK